MFAIDQGNHGNSGVMPNEFLHELSRFGFLHMIDDDDASTSPTRIEALPTLQVTARMFDPVDRIGKGAPQRIPSILVATDVLYDSRGSVNTHCHGTPGGQDWTTKLAYN